MRSSIETKARIKAAALELFAEKGLDCVTTRALSSEADANVAAINYHFGGKDELTVEVFREIARNSAQTRNRFLDELEARCANENRSAKVREIVEAFVAPYLDPNAQQTGVLLAHLITKHRASPNEWTRSVVRDELDEMAQRYISALSKAAPYLTPAAVNWRYHLMVGALVLTVGDCVSGRRIYSLSGDAIVANDLKSRRDEIVDFLEAGFSKS